MITGHPESRRETAGRGLAAVVGAAVVLAVAPPPRQAWQTLTAPGESLDPTAPVMALVALGAWAIAAWLVLGVGLVAASELPGLVGRSAGALAARTVPAAVRRGVSLVLGAGLALGVAAPAHAGDVAPADQRGSTVSLDWPAVAPPTGPSKESPAPPRTQAPSTIPDPTGAGGAARTPGPRPAATRVASTGQPRHTVLVHTGDTLWGLAQRALQARSTVEPSDAQIAATWPTWWAANRAAVGEDPHLLHPGTRLVAPSD